MTKRLVTPVKTSAAPRAAKTQPARPRSRASRLVDETDELIGAPEQPFAEGPASEIDADLRYRMISETAYRHYVERGYADGGDVEDWLQAEAEVDRYLLNPTLP